MVLLWNSHVWNGRLLHPVKWMTVSLEGSCACKLINLTLFAQVHLLFLWNWRKIWSFSNALCSEFRPGRFLWISGHFPMHCAVNLDLGDFCGFVCFPLQSRGTVDTVVLLSTFLKPFVDQEKWCNWLFLHIFWKSLLGLSGTQKDTLNFFVSPLPCILDSQTLILEKL